MDKCLMGTSYHDTDGLVQDCGISSALAVLH